MGDVTLPQPVRLICGIIGVDMAVISAAGDRLQEAFGPIDVHSDVLDFRYTDYYREEMGEKLVRQFVSFRRLIDPGELAGIKLRAVEIERALSAGGGEDRRRLVNLDPGYVTASKLVLATTKNFSHRIYLGRGIYAEVTLNFARRGFRFFAWTYPDFKSGDYDAFLLEVRRRYMSGTA